MVAIEPDALAMSVFIDRRVLARLAAADPLQRLDAGNLADFWTVLEGVSHFLCIAWNARHERDVSVLERFRPRNTTNGAGTGGARANTESRSLTNCSRIARHA